MAISRRFPIPFDVVFPYGAYLVSEVSPVLDFDRSTKERKVQAVDPDTGLLLWSVEVLDADPEAKKSAKTVSVRIPGKVQPVPPPNPQDLPYRPVVFEGMSALPWIEEVGSFTRIAWSLRATAMAEPQKGASSSKAPSPSTSTSSSAA